MKNQLLAMVMEVLLADRLQVWTEKETGQCV